jgi:hypothetical protein
MAWKWEFTTMRWAALAVGVVMGGLAMTTPGSARGEIVIITPSIDEGWMALLGSWGSSTASGVCTFHPDGTVRESDGTAGRYLYAAGQLAIRWESGLRETGSIEWLNDGSFRYRITSYSDAPHRVGRTFIYRRCR